MSIAFYFVCGVAVILLAVIAWRLVVEVREIIRDEHEDGGIG